jgi:hypothetical protein
MAAGEEAQGRREGGEEWCWHWSWKPVLYAR